MKYTMICPLLTSLVSLFFFVPMQGHAMLTDESTGRILESLVEWQFAPDVSAENSDIVLPGNAQWSSLEIPHCFRLSGLPEQSAGFYRRTLEIPAADAGKSFYLFLEGAGSVADVFVNGTHIGRHKGAYTACCFDLTSALQFGKANEIIVRVTNRDKEAVNCLSQSNLFYTNGGLYRPVWLVKVPGLHIFPDSGSTGVYLTPKDITRSGADIEVTTHVRNTLPEAMTVVVRNTITDPDGVELGLYAEEFPVAAGTTDAITIDIPIRNPKRWDLRHPNLYTIRSEVLLNGQVIDAVTERTGLRTIEMKDGDFVLNGKKILCRGVCKHAQDEHVWNAETDEMLKWEMDGMIDLGVNTIRLAHYPHRRFEYNMADEHGVLVWAENGLAGQNWDKGDMKNRETGPTEDGDRITTEMVKQNWNHPSIVFWSSGNETHEAVASHYADTIRALDQTRLVTYALAPGHEKPANVDFVAGNTYQGWYWGHYTDFSELPTNEYVSETGAGSWITHHVPYGTETWDVDHFEPEEYCELFAEFRFQEIFRSNPDGHKFFLWWNYREFYNKKFKSNRNTKGILTLAGLPKDYYYLFQSFLRPDFPVLHLNGRHHFCRRFDPANGIKAYSNSGEVELFVNGTSQGVMKNGDYVLPNTDQVVNNVFFWKAPLAPGKNVIEARDDRGNSQSMIIYQHADEMPVPADSLVVDLKSSSPNNPALFIDRPIEAQGPFYYGVDGSSDNTFDALPRELEGARWIATRRLSDPDNKSDLSFTLTKPATVYVMYSTGTFPAHTLDKPDDDMMKTASLLKADLAGTGFAETGISGTWRRHSLWLADFGLMRRTVESGDTIILPGQTLDYVVLVKPR